jgi:hypothetical protein
MRLITVLTPITNTSRVLSPSIEHRTDNHKARRDRTFTDSKDETNGEKTGKAFASRMATQSNAPDKYVQASRTSLQKWSSMKNVCSQPHPFPDGKPLQRQILWELEGEISEIEDRSEPDPRQ